MSNPRTLSELDDLKNSGFGRPPPRHGLKLLYWFANDVLFFNNNNQMCWRDNPKSKEYGFHRFRNRKDRNGVKLLPDTNLTYYMVGNLNSEGADELPPYVQEDYGNFEKNNNMDRIIVSVAGQCFDRVYVTEHSDRRDFNKEATYCISWEIVMMIRNMTLEEFLAKSGYLREQEYWDQRPGYLREQEYTDQRPGYLREQEYSDQRPGYLREQEYSDQRPGYLREQEYSDQRPGYLREQEYSDQRPGYSGAKTISYERFKDSRTQEYTGLRQEETTDDRSGEDAITGFWNDNGSANCCRCVIL